MPADRLETLRRSIEATRLSFGLTRIEVERLASDARRLGVRAVCVPLRWLSIASAGAEPRSADFELVTVANFPTGDHGLSTVRQQAATAAAQGADQIDLVVPGELVMECQWKGLTDFIRAVRIAAEERAPGQIAIKAILETAALDEERIRAGAEAAIEAGVRWLKTSTGFHPAGGATERTVSLLRAIAPAEVGVKASGGIRTREIALAMLAAGADRIGTSSEKAILDDSPAPQKAQGFS